MLATTTDTARASYARRMIVASCLGRFRQNPCRPRGCDETCQASGFGCCSHAACRRDRVVATAFIVGVVGVAMRTSRRRRRIAVGDETPERTIERARFQTHLAVGPGLHFLNDRVAMTVAVSEREEDLELDRPQRWGARTGSHWRHYVRHAHSVSASRDSCRGRNRMPGS